ncbi:MAG: hypothetical protein QOG89_1256 [Thermomicrobiales bacterium]|nr:hypothetical protein [Thermomicrobiales bacterium]
MLRHLALNLLRWGRIDKIGVEAKRLRCGWDHDNLLEVLAS